MPLLLLLETAAFQLSVLRQQHPHQHQQYQQRRETNCRNLQTTSFVKSNNNDDNNDVEEEKNGRKDQLPFSISQSRRSAATSIVATAAAVMFSGSSQASAAATTISLDTLTDETQIVKEKCVDYVVKDFTITLPSTWNIITKFDDKSDKKKPTPTIFSAIDFNSGSVVSVVQEEACDLNEYAKSSFGSSSSSDKSSPSKICDFLLKDNPLSLFSTETYPKDASKLLIRHDDRDNAVLQGLSQLEDSQLFGESKAASSSSSSSSSPLLELRATTTIPSGGTHRDTMGLEQPNTIDRKVVAKAVASTSTNTSTSTDTSTTTATTKVVSIWLSAPLDEWQKPVMGTKLTQIWDSVKYDTN